MHRTQTRAIRRIKPIKSRLSERQTNMNHCRKISGVVPGKMEERVHKYCVRKKRTNKLHSNSSGTNTSEWNRDRDKGSERKKACTKNNEQIASRAKSMPILLCVCRKCYALDAFAFIYIHLHTLLTIQRYNPYARKVCTALPHRAHSILAISRKKSIACIILRT